MKNKPSWKSLYLSFVTKRLNIGHIEHSKSFKNGSSSPKEPTVGDTQYFEIKVSADPIKHHLKNEYWFCRKEHKVRQLAD